jgi:hypothetical protein
MRAPLHLVRGRAYVFKRALLSYLVSIYAYSGVVRFITDYLIGGYIFTLFDRFYQSTKFFLNLLLYMLT